MNGPVRILLRAAPGPSDAAFTWFERPQRMAEIARMIAGGGALDSFQIRDRIELEILPRMQLAAAPEPPEVKPAAFRFVLDRGYVVIVDDRGFGKGLPENAVASSIYRRQCKPDAFMVTDEGRVVAPTVVGDVFICPDEDFA